MTYSEKLKHPKWQKKRLEILKRDNWSCTHCGCAEKNLQVHHRFYLKNRDPWDYPSETLDTLCESCHKTMEETRVKLLAMVTLDNADKLIGYLKSESDCAVVLENSEQVTGLFDGIRLPLKQRSAAERILLKNKYKYKKDIDL